MAIKLSKWARSIVWDTDYSRPPSFRFPEFPPSVARPHFDQHLMELILKKRDVSQAIICCHAGETALEVLITEAQNLQRLQGHPNAVVLKVRLARRFQCNNDTEPPC